MKFKNPQNGYIVETNHPGLWTLIFGCFYLAKHGAWGFALIAFVAALLTAGISWLIFPFFGGKIIRDSYLRKGWIELDEPMTKNFLPPRPNAT